MSEGRIIETARSEDLKINPDGFPKIKKFIAGHE
jgi:hypothetical protein